MGSTFLDVLASSAGWDKGNFHNRYRLELLVGNYVVETIGKSNFCGDSMWLIVLDLIFSWYLCNRYVFDTERDSKFFFIFSCRILGPPALQQAARSGDGLFHNNRPIYNNCMRGVITCFTGIRKKDELVSNFERTNSLLGNWVVLKKKTESSFPSISIS